MIHRHFTSNFSSTDLIYSFRACKSLYAKPEHGQDDTADDAEVAEPEPERRPVEHREGDMKTCTSCSVQNHDYGDNNMAESNRRQRLSPNSRMTGSKYHASQGNNTRTNQESPTASMLEASSHTAAFVASEIQYAM